MEEKMYQIVREKLYESKSFNFEKTKQINIYIAYTMTMFITWIIYSWYKILASLNVLR